MGFFDKIRASLARFMSGRYGADQLSYAMVILALAVFRMFSRNTSRRFAENYRFLKLWNPVKSWFQWLWLSIRYCNKNRYFLCPKCRRIACVPKGTGRVTITCKGCKHKYDKKA